MHHVYQVAFEILTREGHILQKGKKNYS